MVGGGRPSAAGVPADRGRNPGAVGKAGGLAGLLGHGERRAGGQAMSEPRLISGYLAVLADQLPAPIVEELADGLTETHRSYLQQGMAPDLAAASAVAEFGEPQEIVAEFARVNPARRAARRLLGIGPVVGACWAAALITDRASAWPVPLTARIVVGLALITIIVLLAASALSTRYRLAAR